VDFFVGALITEDFINVEFVNDGMAIQYQKATPQMFGEVSRLKTEMGINILRMIPVWLPMMTLSRTFVRIVRLSTGCFGVTRTSRSLHCLKNVRARSSWIGKTIRVTWLAMARVSIILFSHFV